MDVKDRVAIITGASGGLGKVVAQRFAAGGARLALLDRNPERLSQLVSDLRLTEDRYLLSASDLIGPEAARDAAKDDFLITAYFG